MQLLNSIGLGFDFVGVILLGVDLIKVQIGLKSSAISRLDKAAVAKEVAVEAGEFAREFRLDHRHYDLDEGQPLYFEGTFDKDSARAAERAAQASIQGLATSAQRLADLIESQAFEDVEASARSLLISYTGLGLVALGFGLQLASNILT